MTLLNGRYATHEVLGTGTYGCVLRCTDTQTGQQVAVKIAKRDAAYRRSAINEINVLKLLSYSDETVYMLDFFEENGHVCIVFEFLCTDFYSLIHLNNFRPVPLQVVRICAQRILYALVLLHQEGYIHCDIKPANVMLRSDKTQRNILESCAGTCLIDFGAARPFHENKYYDVQSLWYRAPEVILGVPYTPLIDSWSVGCFLYELYTGNTLFPGNSPQEQIVRIAHTVGMPNIELVMSGENSAVLQLPCLGVDVNGEGQLRHLIAKCCFTAGYGQEYCDSIEEENAFVNLLCMLLQPDARMRLSCADALHHPFFTSFGWQRKDKKNYGNSAYNTAGGGLWRWSDHVMLTGSCAFNSSTLSTGANIYDYNCFNHFTQHCQLPEMYLFHHLRVCPTCRELTNHLEKSENNISFLTLQQLILRFPHVLQHAMMCSAAPIKVMQPYSFYPQEAVQTIMQPHAVNMCVSCDAFAR